MHKNLQKVLKRTFQASKGLDRATISDIIKQARDGANCLITIPDGPQSMSLVVDIAHKFISADECLWYVVPSNALSPFKTYWLEGGIGSEFLSVRCLWRIDDANTNIVIWSAEILRDNLLEILSTEKQSLPKLVILEDFEYLGETNIGLQLEEIVLRLPGSISILAIMPFVRNTQEILSWLEKVRNRPCRLVKIGIPENRNVLAFLTPEWDLIPLLSKKKVANRVKQFLKNKPATSAITSHRFVQPLLSLIRQEKMTPALIFMSSEKECEEAWKNCPDVGGEAGKVITSPQIAAIFERHPILKDRKKVLNVLCKRAGSLHSARDPAWCEMIELFLALNHIDVAFTTIDFAQALITGVNTVVLTTSLVHIINTRQMRPATKREMYQVWKLVRNQGIDNLGCTIVVNTRDMNVVHLKDLYDASPDTILSQFRCNYQTVLGLSAIGKMNPNEALNYSFFAAQKQPEDTSRLNELLNELQEKIPECACNSPLAAIAVIDIYRQLKIQLDKTAVAMKKGKAKTKEKFATLQLEISQLPCEKCVHQQDCQKMGYRKIKTIVDEYHSLRHKLEKTSSILEIDFKDCNVPLIKLGFIDSDQRLTNKGLIALRTGLDLPQLVTECVHLGVIPLDDSSLSSAIVAGFVEHFDSDRPQLVEDFIEQPLRDGYAKIDEVIKPLKDQLLRLGLFIPGPFLEQSAVMLAWENGVNQDTILEKARISSGCLTRLVLKGKYLKRQLMDRGGI